MRDTISGPAFSPRAPRARLPVVLGALLLCAAGGAARAQGQKSAGEGQERPPMLDLRPFEEVAAEGRLMVWARQIGPETTLDMVVTAERAADGTLRPETIKFSGLDERDAPLASLVRHAVDALSRSRVLSLLEGAKAVRIAFKLDLQNVSFRLDSEMPSAAEAAEFAQGYEVLRIAGGISKRGMPEEALFDHMGFTSEGKLFKMSFEMPRFVADRMIAEMLAQRAARKGR